LAGGCALLAVALKVAVPDGLAGVDEPPPAPGGADAAAPVSRPRHGLAAAIAVILLADLVMSLDNVIALAAASGGRSVMLV
ncbi:TerC family protein, partial [Vibrio parahaemolyticus]